MFAYFIILLLFNLGTLGMEIVQVPDNEEWSKINALDSLDRKSDDYINIMDTANDTALLTVFYETLCPDCKDFFMHQLFPVVIRLFRHVNIHLVPYGHAKTIYFPNGTIEFECQHGPAECYGNSLHACAIHYLKMTGWLSTIFNTCLMAQAGKGSGDAALSACSMLMVLETDNVSNCAKGFEASHLVYEYGIETNRVRPRSVPYVLLNGHGANQDRLTKQLFSAVCASFKRPPPECK